MEQSPKLNSYEQCSTIISTLITTLISINIVIITLVIDDTFPQAVFAPLLIGSIC